MNYEESKKKKKKLLLARIPLIIFNTVEKERVLKMVKELNSESESSVFVHSMSSGMYDLNSGNKVSDEKTLMSILTFSHLIKRAWPKRAKLFGQAQLLINIILSPFNGHIKRHHRRYF